MSAHSDSPETEIYAAHKNDVYEFVDPEWDWVVPAAFARNIERQRNEAREELRQVREENARLRDRLFILGAMKDAPCFCCGYGGPGYFQPDQHSCAAKHHKLYKP